MCAGTAPGKPVGMARRLVLGWLACGVIICSAFGAAHTAPRSRSGTATRHRTESTDESAGRTIWLRDCAVCHGADARGGEGGPDISRRGAAAVDFMVTTGRMPLPSPTAALQRRRSPYNAAQQRALIDYASTLVTGPAIPRVDIDRSNLSHGGAAYRQNCATCHQSAGSGGALAFGENAPDLSHALPTQVVEAMRIGPGTMPKFPRATISATQADQIAAYVQELRHPADPGGIDLGRLGPVPEGLIAWVFGLGALMLITRLLGRPRRSG